MTTIMLAMARIGVATATNGTSDYDGEAVMAMNGGGPSVSAMRNTGRND